MTELAKDKIASRQEIIIPITVRGIYKALRLISFDKPRDWTSIAAEKAERLSQWMMSGHAAIVTQPLGIMLRNASRAVLGVTVEDRSAWWGGFSYLAGVAGAVGALYLTVPALAGVVGATVVGSIAGSWGALALSAAICAPLVLPAFGATFLLATGVTGLVVGVVSVFPALANIGVAVNRTLDAWKGVKYDETVLQNGQSMGDKLRDRRENKVLSAFHALPKAKQDKAVDYVTGNRCPSAEHVLSTLSETEQQKLLAALSAKFAAAATSGTPLVGSAVPATKPKGIGMR